MKILAEYKFTNNKAFRLELLNAKDKKNLEVPSVDNFHLVFELGKGNKKTIIIPLVEGKNSPQFCICNSALALCKFLILFVSFVC